MKPIVIYHGSCLDGFAAAWAAWSRLGDAAEYVAANYGDSPPQVLGRDVYIVDFSYPRDTIEQMSQNAGTITILDHHESAMKKWDARAKTTFFETARNVTVRFDMAKAGSTMAWEHFHPETPVPKLIQHVADGDLYTFELEGTKEFRFSLDSFNKDFQLWTQLAAAAETNIESFVIEGDGINRYRRHLIKDILATGVRTMRIGPNLLRVVCCPKQFSSEVGNWLAEQSPNRIGVTYWDFTDRREFSLRSTDDGPNVAALCEQYGGGGHAKAAGFKKMLGWEGD